MSELIAAEGLQGAGHKWVIVGDWNTKAKDKEECPSWGPLARAGGKEYATDKATRWEEQWKLATEGSLAIDWAVANSYIPPLRQMEKTFSDHVGLELRLRVGAQGDRKAGGGAETSTRTVGRNIAGRVEGQAGDGVGAIGGGWRRRRVEDFGGCRGGGGD